MADITTNPDIDILTNWYAVDPSQNDSTDNDYLHVINDIMVGQYKSGAYGVDWSSVSLPSSPSYAKWCIRLNTDDGNQQRLYSWNGEKSEWEFTVFRGAISVTTEETGIVAVGTGTAIDYGSSSARVNHAMQMVAYGNTGSINEVEVALEASINGVDFFTIFSLFAKDLITSEINNVINTLVLPVVKLRRNVILFDVSGDASIDIIITSV